MDICLRQSKLRRNELAAVRRSDFPATDLRDGDGHDHGPRRPNGLPVSFHSRAGTPLSLAFAQPLRHRPGEAPDDQRPEKLHAGRSEVQEIMTPSWRISSLPVRAALSRTSGFLRIWLGTLSFPRFRTRSVFYGVVEDRNWWSKYIIAFFLLLVRNHHPSVSTRWSSASSSPAWRSKSSTDGPSRNGLRSSACHSPPSPWSDWRSRSTCSRRRIISRSDRHFLAPSFSP